MNEHDFHNLIRVLQFAVEHGVVKSLDDSRVVLLLETKLKQALEEATSGNDVPGSPE